LENEARVYLKEILDLPILKSSHVLTASDKLVQSVSSVNVMLDKEILDWIEQDDQIILTTGKIVENLSDSDQLDLFQSIFEKKVAAVFVKITPYLTSLPKPVIDLCNALDLAVIDLDYDVSFTEIFSEVYKLMFAKQNQVLQRVENLHKDTMNAVVNGGTIEDILKSIYKTIKSPIFVRDYYLEDTYFLRGTFEDAYAILHDNIENTQLDQKNSKIVWDHINYQDREIERILVPIFVKNRVHGHIAMYGRSEPITNYDQLGLEATSNIIALEFLKKISVQEVENKYKLEFFDDLISLDEVRRRKAVARAGNFRLSENAQYVIFKVVGEHQSGIKDSEINIKISYLIELICKDMSRAFMILNKSDHLYVMIMVKDSDALDVIKKYASAMYDILKSKMKKYHIKIGIGRTWKTLLNVHRSLVDADKAMEASQKYLDSDIVYFEEMGVYKILSQPAIQSELEIFYKETIDRLVIYDTRKDTELVKTIEAYYACNGNLKRMSEVLFTHYNTILYRLNRIQDIIEMNLDDEEARYAIQTALKIYKMQN